GPRRLRTIDTSDTSGALAVLQVCSPRRLSPAQTNRRRGDGSARLVMCRGKRRQGGEKLREDAWFSRGGTLPGPCPHPPRLCFFSGNNARPSPQVTRIPALGR